MKKMLLMTCTLLALAAGIAVAGPGGLNLSWTDCDAAGTQDRTFACNTNLGTNILVGSFVTPCCVESCSANEIVMDIQSAGATLPAWWQLRAPQCHAAQLTQSGDFSTFLSGACVDYWASAASGGVSQDLFIGNRARIKALEGLPAGSPLIGGISEGTQVYSFQVKISNLKTAGTTGNCAGCNVGVCIVLNSIKINQTVHTVGGDKFVSAPAHRNWATWQGGIGGDCYGATPAKNTTWGTVKALYR